MNSSHFCTLFDSSYLSRGLALHQSLTAQTPGAILYILAMDETCRSSLERMDLVQARIISIDQFEDDRLHEAKAGRTVAEYCWTCTPSLLHYCIRKFELDCCTYVDADTYFFSDASALIEEMQDASVLITEHRYSPEYDFSRSSGKYCVQFVTIKNTAEGMRVLEDWKNACIQWCYARYEDGKFGDQMYLDAWPYKYEGVHELMHIGGGVAPWNVQRYRIRRGSDQGTLLVSEKSDANREVPLVFYHFHGFKMLNSSLYSFNTYELNNTVKKLLYWPYISVVEELGRKVKERDPGLDPHGVTRGDDCRRLTLARLVFVALKILARHLLRFFPEVFKAVRKYADSYPVQSLRKVFPSSHDQRTDSFI
jgi:hypothetical protein